ncbi:MAG: beta-ribofuranosylaminobenzene 5'-phosphate synthase family protein [Gemmatimonadaceae bacterium]
MIAPAARADGEAVFVEAAARLHMGVLDLRGSLGRSFGGIGAAAPAPTLLLSATAADGVEAEGEDAARAAGFALRFLAFHGLAAGARLRVHRALPGHAGLGSGTQLALAVARALAELHGLPTDAPSLARAVGRAQRSAVGTWVFAGGGFVVEGGRRSGSDAAGPLLSRIPFPPAWRCVIAVPDAAPGISGDAEAAAFARLPPPSERDVERVAYLVLMGLLPAVAEGELATFGAALTEVQEVTGRWWAPVQGGTFAPGPGAELVGRMREWGAAGVGQSSWGPAVYALVEGAEAGAMLAARARAALGGGGAVYEGPFPAAGARVWRAPADAPAHAPADAGARG